MSDNLKAFVLFEFEVDKGVEVVPSTWISKDKTLCQFPNPIPKGFSSYQSGTCSLPRKGWTNYGILYVGTYDTYDKAANKLKIYIKNKPIDSSDNDIPRRRRRKLSPETSEVNIILAPDSDLCTDRNSTVPIAFPSIEEVSSETPQVQILQLEPDPRIESLLANLLRDSVKAGNPDPSVKDSKINHHIGCWFRMKFTSNQNADVQANAETLSGETTSKCAEMDTDRRYNIDNATAGSNSLQQE